jgi:hypothetical protein
MMERETDARCSASISNNLRSRSRVACVSQNEELKDDGFELHHHRASHTTSYIQNFTREEWLALCTVKNTGPMGSKYKVFKIK